MRDPIESPVECPRCITPGCIGECGTIPFHGEKYHLDPDEIAYCNEVIRRWEEEEAARG